MSPLFGRRRKAVPADEPAGPGRDGTPATSAGPGSSPADDVVDHAGDATPSDAGLPPRTREEELAEELEAERAALMATQRRYRALADASDDVVFEADGSGRFVWVSLSVGPLLGWDPDALIGHRVLDIVAADDHAAMGHVRRDDALVRVRTGDGSIRTMASRGQPILDAPDRVGGWLVRWRDADAAARSRAALDEARAQLADVLDAQFAAALVLEIVRDARGEVADLVCAIANASARTDLGDPQGRSLSGVWNAPGPDDLVARCVRVAATGEALDIVRWPSSDADPVIVDIRAARLGDVVLLTWRDVTQRATTEADAEALRLLSETTTDVILHLRDLTIAWVSPSLERILGWQPREWTDELLTRFANRDDLADMLVAWEAMTPARPSVMRLRLVDRTGAFHWVELRTRVRVGADGQPDGTLSSFRVVDREVATDQTLERLARYDELTGAVNRAEALTRLGSVRAGRREPGTETALLLVDVDGLTAVNDAKGTAAGDELLRGLVQRFRSVLRAGDTVARHGGDEFLIILTEIHDITDVETVGEKVRASALESVATPHGLLGATVSIGGILCRPDETTDAMIVRAEHALADAKAGGGNLVSCDRDPGDLSRTPTDA